jgi:hypothetical protein
MALFVNPRRPSGNNLAVLSDLSASHSFGLRAAPWLRRNFRPPLLVRQFHQCVSERLRIKDRACFTTCASTSRSRSFPPSPKPWQPTRAAVCSQAITPRRIFRAIAVTANAFQFLGVAPAWGRTIQPGDLGPDRSPAPVIVLSYKAWQRLSI